MKWFLYLFNQEYLYWEYTKCVRKLPAATKVYFETKIQTTSFSFWNNSLEFNALPHPSLTLLHALLEGFFRDSSQLCRHGLFYVIPVLKTGLLDDSLELGKRKNHTESGEENASLRQCSSRPGIVRCSANCKQVCCHGEAVTSCLTKTLTSSRLLNKPNALVFLCRQASWLSDLAARTHSRWFPSHRKMCLTTWLKMSVFLRP